MQDVHANFKHGSISTDSVDQNYSFHGSDTTGKLVRNKTRQLL